MRVTNASAGTFTPCQKVTPSFGGGQAPRGPGGKDAHALRRAGAEVRHRRPDGTRGRRGAQPRQAPVHPRGRCEHPLAPEDGRRLALGGQIRRVPDAQGADPLGNGRLPRCGHRPRGAGDPASGDDMEVVAHLGPDLLGDDWEPGGGGEPGGRPRPAAGGGTAGPAGDGGRRKRLRQRALLRVGSTSDIAGERGEGSAADRAARSGHALAEQVRVNRTTTETPGPATTSGSTAGSDALPPVRYDVESDRAQVTGTTEFRSGVPTARPATRYVRPCRIPSMLRSASAVIDMNGLQPR